MKRIKYKIAFCFVAISILIITSLVACDQPKEPCDCCFAPDINNVLILQNVDEGVKLYYILQNEFNTTLKSIEYAPVAVNCLKAWDKIILMGISNKDMPLGFDSALYSFVYNYGGGVLNIGENEFDLKNAVSNMLPIHAREYYAPIALMIVIDAGASMNNAMDSQSLDFSRLDAAIQVAQNIARQYLSLRDYIGVIYFNDGEATKVFPLTSISKLYDQYHMPKPFKQEFLHALQNITAKGYSNFAKGLQLAYQTLFDMQHSFVKRNIMFISDAKYDFDYDAAKGLLYLDKINATNITFSIKVMLENYAQIKNNIEYMIKRAGNTGYAYFPINVASPPNPPLVRCLRTKVLQGFVSGDFALFYGQKLAFVGGFYAFGIGAYCIMKTHAATVLLTNRYGHHLMAYWDYGKGRVASFLVRLWGEYAGEFFESEGALEFLLEQLRNL